MMRPLPLALLATLLLPAQQVDFRDTINRNAHLPKLAVPDFRGDSRTQALAATFNQTLWNDLDDSAFFSLAPKTNYPLTVPQQPGDFRTPDFEAAQSSGGGGLWTQDWSHSPTGVDYLAGGYLVAQTGSFYLRGWLADVSRPAAATMLDKPYREALDVAGARTAAHKFAADILRKFGATPLLGSHIYFVRETTPAPDRRTEIWMMDYDGANARQITHCGDNCTQPAVSPDGSKLACVRVGIHAGIEMYSLDTGRQLPFANGAGSPTVAAPSFSPDGKQLLFSQYDGHTTQIWTTNLGGSHPQRLTSGTADNTEPKLNPKTGAEIAFTSGRTGHAQLYLMGSDGSNVEHLAGSLGESTNPSWHPSGQVVAFAGTKGAGTAAWNIFRLTVGRDDLLQLTHDAGDNENPSWAPDGVHLIFKSTRTGTPQLWTMLADGTRARQITHEGRNSTPVWGP